MFRLVRQTNPQARTVFITGHRGEMDQLVQQGCTKGRTPFATNRSTSPNS